MRITSSTIAIAGLAAAMMTTIALAADRSGGDGQKPEPDVYQPVTSDLMNAFIQPRHIKLWLAGEAQNWEYAEYERHNIGGALRRLATAIPTYQGQSTDSLITAFATPQLDALETSIKAKDPAAFKTAYEGLTAGCNQCHQATGHGMVILKTPTADSFPDQIFQTANR